VDESELAAKHARLEGILRSLGRVVVAFSGGVDSSLLLKVAVDTLGTPNVLAVLGRSPSLPQDGWEWAQRVVGQLGAQLHVLDTNEFSDPHYLANPVDRCYYCKTSLYRQLGELCAARGFAGIVCGANADDAADFRPGARAGIERLVRAPLAEAGLTKPEVRELSRKLALPTWSRPASPCLASRVPYGEPVTPEKLRMIDAAETFLRELGVEECRVRCHGQVARVEVPPSHLAHLAEPALAARIDAHLRELGFQYVALDLRGFRSGSLNEVVSFEVQHGLG